MEVTSTVEKRVESKVAAVRSGSDLFAAPRRALKVWCLLILFAGAVKLLDVVFVQLNARKIILPRFDVSQVAYYDAGFTNDHNDLARYNQPPKMIFTGDSRTKNAFDPEIIAAELGVPPETFFNFGTDSQATTFVSKVLLPHLIEMNRQPRYLIFGVTPEWLLNRSRIWDLVEEYENSPARRIGKTRPDDPLETRLTNLMIRNLALYRYRGDFIARELLPDLRCWLLRSCELQVGYGSMHFKEVERLEGRHTKYGWYPQAWDGKTKGVFMGKPRFDPRDPPDRENLVALIREVRASGIVPVFVVMPLHPSFWKAHEPGVSRAYQVLTQVAEQEGVDVIRPPGDFRDASLFVDGHHLSHKGTAYFSASVAHELRRYIMVRDKR